MTSTSGIQRSIDFTDDMPVSECLVGRHSDMKWARKALVLFVARAQMAMATASRFLLFAL